MPTASTKPGPSIAEQIRDARAEAGLTQEELAERVGVRRVTLSAVENGYNASLDLLQRIASELGRPITICPGLPAPRQDRPGRSSKKK